MLGVRTAGPRQVLSDSRRVLGGFLAVLGRFSAYLQRVLGGFSFRLALDLIFGGSGGPEAARLVPGWPKMWPQGAQESSTNHKKTEPFLQSVFGSKKWAPAFQIWTLLAPFWEAF